MAKVTVGAAFTLNLGNYQSAKYDMMVSEIDTEAPLEPQLEAAKATALGTAAWVEDMLYQRMRENDLIEAVRGRKA